MSEKLHVQAQTGNVASRSTDDTVIQAAEPSRLPHRRTDWYSARTIEEGIRLQAERGTQAAAVFFKDKSIVADITVRTLLHPDQRRSS